jgi:hypothetical protein
VWSPCVIQWQPTIYCTAGIAKHGHTLSGQPDIPWHCNIQEIYVESRRAQAILDQIAPAGRAPIVRILPPVPNTDHISHTAPQHGIACFCTLPEDIKMAGAIFSRVEAPGAIFVGRWTRHEFKRAACVVFPNWEMASVQHLRLAIESGTRIVSSDAGAAQEYLSLYGRPGMWHIVNNWDAPHYVEAIRDLMGLPNEMPQTDYIDQVPYLPAVGKGEGK